MVDMTDSNWWQRNAVWDKALTKYAERKGIRVEEAALDPAGIKEADLVVAQRTFGPDVKLDANGKAPQDAGSNKGAETANHFASILKYEGREAHARAVREIYKRDPERAKKLGLPEPQRAA